MTDKRDVVLARRGREEQFERTTVAYTGTIQSRDGSVNVPGIPNHVWVLPTDESEPEAVYNRQVKARAGLPVVVGYAPKSRVLEILSTDVEHLAGYTETGGLDMASHGNTHRSPKAGGDDPVWVDRDLIIDQLYLSPGAGLAANISPYEYDDYLTGQRQYFPGQLNFSIAAHKPAAGLALYVLVYLDTADNTIKTVAGATVPDLDWMIPPKPDTPDGGNTAGYVRLDGSQTTVSRGDIDQGRRMWLATRTLFDDTEGDPEPVGGAAADGTSSKAARRDHVHTIDLTAFTAETTADDADLILIYDDTAAAHRKMTRANYLAGLSGVITGTFSVKPGGGGDWTTLAGMLAALQGKTVLNTTVNVDAGTYSEGELSAAGFLTGAYTDLQIVGDTRVITGLTYAHNGLCNPAALANGGSGKVTLSSSGNDITIAGSVTNPNFATAGLVNGDQVLVKHSGGWTTYTVSSVSSNVITLTIAAPVISANGYSVTILPNRRIIPPTNQSGLIFPGTPVRWSGFYVAPSSNNVYPVLSNGGKGSISRVVVAGVTSGIGVYALGGATVEAYYCSALACSAGFMAESSFVYAPYTFSVGADYGYLSYSAGRMSAVYATAIAGSSNGFLSTSQSNIFAYGAAAVANAVGYGATWNAMIDAGATDANNDNTVDYDPATSGSEGATEGIILWS